MEHQASGARGPFRLPPHVLDEELAADGDEDCRLRDGIGAEVVQLCSIVLAQGPHEPTDGDAESPLVQMHEAHDVAFRRIRLGLLRPRGNPLPQRQFWSSWSPTGCYR